MNSILVRSRIFHTPRNPFRELTALEFLDDGAILIEHGRIVSCGPYLDVSRAGSHAQVLDLRDGYVLPGFIDSHVHFPQVRALGGLGCQLLDWLQKVALPEEARMADPLYARDIAKRFVRDLIASGATTALVFGAHFSDAVAELFEAASAANLRMVSGMVLSDRLLRPELHQTPSAAYRQSKELIAKYHGQNRILYAVTPRFALSASEAMLAVCQTLMTEHPDVRFTSHINENGLEIEEVARLFPWADDYLAVYERFGLTRRGAVLAHNVHASDSVIARLAGSHTAVAHCPWSNALLGSGLFRMRRHIEAQVTVALGTDVGGGAGFGVLKEALQAYALQRISPDGMNLSPAQLLYLSTLAGAEALGLASETGDFSAGKSADFVYVQPSPESLLKGVIERAETPESILAAMFALAGEQAIRGVWVEGVRIKP